MHYKVSDNIPVACLFQTESPILFKPFIKDLTKSEIHAIMTEGFATVAGKIIRNIFCWIIKLNSYLSELRNVSAARL
jgi:nucleoside permease NupC